jgi:hypothetical protein
VEHNSVSAAFGVSYRHLDPGLRKFFRRLALHPGTTIDGYAAALAGGRLKEAAGQLDALHGEGLVTEAGYRRYGMHDLIRSNAGISPPETRPPAQSRRWNGCWITTKYTATLAETLLAL